ncbi:hypothetical protein MTO96_032403 [Rhipicephalus appendiculatus]
MTCDLSDHYYEESRRGSLQYERVLRTSLSPPRSSGERWTLEASMTLGTCLTTTTKNQEEATLKNVEKAAMTWFRHAAERAAAGHRRPPTSNDEEVGI